jgi:2-polyprenyl-3-methyl-5-hydroxy-6-metoxy-1,4-benzoquinol methylase
MIDTNTVDVYNQKASEYAGKFDTDRPDPWFDTFRDAVTPGGTVLELGCGPGRTAARLRDAGFTVDAVDASSEMAAVAMAQFNLTVRIATFDDLSGTDLYDGIWANFSLLHAAKSDLPRHLAALATAARPGCILHLGMKEGTGEDRDSIGRFYAYYGVDELRSLVTDAGFTVTRADFGAGAGLAGSVEPWIILTAHA